MAAAYISPAAEGAKPSAARPRHSGVRKTLENLIHLIFLLCGVVAVAFVLLISIYLILSGIPAIREIGLGKFLFGKVWDPTNTTTGAQYGILAFILTSIYGTAGAILIGVPVGLLTAVFLARVAPPRLAAVIRTAVQLLAGIPSVVYGLVGMIVLVPAIQKTFSLSSGACLLAAILVLAVMILGIVYKAQGGEYIFEDPFIPETTQNAFVAYGRGLGTYALEVLRALSPIAAFFALFQLVTRAFAKRQLIKVLIGIVYTFCGLTFFLTGANVGFMPVGREIGKSLASLWGGWLLVPVGMLLGYFVVSAEPAVYVLNKQVEHMSAGAVSASAMKKGLCIGVCAALGFAMLRIVVGFNVMWLLLPGYAVALVLMFFAPRLFTGIAFDSGGVASGAMVSSFVLPMAIGACSVIAPSEIMTLAFGCAGGFGAPHQYPGAGDPL